MAKDTRENILDSALLLFNSQNVDQVTIREVAKKAGISHGNLCYHFPNIENLVENLYKRLVAELDNQFTLMTGREISLTVLQESSANTFRILYKYKFLMLDFVSVMRASKFIRDHYRKLYKFRKEQFRIVLGWMLSEGYLKSELYPGHYEKVIEQLFIIGDFWIASSEILFEGKEKDKVAYYADIVNQVLLPYFTEKTLSQLSGSPGPGT
jgi:AcrR family transcriptional regulator